MFLVAGPLAVLPVSQRGTPAPISRLSAHVARANPLWQRCASGSEVLVIFRGAEAYVSPNWYPSKQEAQRQVPTWNYEAVPAKFDELAHVCRVSGGGAAFVPWLRALKQHVGITGTLTTHGVTAAHLSRLVEIAQHDICHQTNPRPCTAADFERLFRAAL